MAKTVVTYSWLARKAMALHRKDRDEYNRLLDLGSEKILPGAQVRWYGHNHSCNWFEIRVSGKKWCNIHAAEFGGKFYTFYQPAFTTTQYRKRLVDRYMPFTLPEGVRSHYNDKGGHTPCLYHNADGSVALTGHWAGGRRNRPGRPGHPLTVCDTTGEFVQDLDLAIQVAQTTNHPTLLHLGWFDQASKTRKEWLESIAALPHCDTQMVMTVAAKAYLAASRMCDKFPKMRMALFPPTQAPQNTRYGGNFSAYLTLARNSNDEPVNWVMPEVLLYWQEKSQYLTLSMTIPPHGCPLLDPTGRAGLLSWTGAYSHRIANHWDRAEYPQALTSACHQLLAYAPDSPVLEREYMPSASSYYYPYGQNYAREHRTEKFLTFWPDHTDKVLVRTEAHRPNGEESDLPLPYHIPLAMTPEGVMLMFEEKFLMESLPLC